MHMSYLLSTAITLLVRSDKLVVGLALRLGLAALSDPSMLFSVRLRLSSWSSSEITLSLLSTKPRRLFIETRETDRKTMHESTHAIATKYTKQRIRSDVNLFVGSLALFDSCSI